MKTLKWLAISIVIFIFLDGIFLGGYFYGKYSIENSHRNHQGWRYGNESTFTTTTGNYSTNCTITWNDIINDIDSDNGTFIYRYREADNK